MTPDESAPPTDLDDLNWEIRTRGAGKPFCFTNDDGLLIAIDALIRQRGPRSLELIHHPTKKAAHPGTAND